MQNHSFQWAAYDGDEIFSVTWSSLILILWRTIASNSFDWLTRLSCSFPNHDTTITVVVGDTGDIDFDTIPVIFSSILLFRYDIRYRYCKLYIKYYYYYLILFTRHATAALQQKLILKWPLQNKNTIKS